jgi:hypothetical protein
MNKETKDTSFAPPSLFSAFHGRGAAAYSSAEAKRQFARSLQRLADRLFWAPVAFLVLTGLTQDIEWLITQCFLTFALLCVALYCRHYALTIYDHLPKKARKTTRAAALPVSGRESDHSRDTSPVQGVS